MENNNIMENVEITETPEVETVDNTVTTGDVVLGLAGYLAFVGAIGAMIPIGINAGMKASEYLFDEDKIQERKDKRADRKEARLQKKAERKAKREAKKLKLVE